jgi:diacylglycerol kinase
VKGLLVVDRRTWRGKFRDAFRGLWFGLQGQSSFFVHVIVAAAAVALGWWTGISAVEWALISLSIGLVFAAELANTALEWLARAVTDKTDERVGRALDLASAAVLSAAGTALAVGACVFAPRLWALVR